MKRESLPPSEGRGQASGLSPSQSWIMNEVVKQFRQLALSTPRRFFKAIIGDKNSTPYLSATAPFKGDTSLLSKSSRHVITSPNKNNSKLIIWRWFHAHEPPIFSLAGFRSPVPNGYETSPRNTLHSRISSPSPSYPIDAKSRGSKDLVE